MEEKEKERKISLRQLRYIVAGLVFLQIVVIVTTAIVLRDRGGSGDETKDVSTFVPIWLVILIPFIASRKKSRSEEQKKKGLWIFVVLGALFLLAATIFLLKALRT